MSAPPCTTIPDPAANPEPAGRDGKGRFAKGNSYGPGNPFARQVAALRSRLLARVTEGDVDAVADQLIKMAKEGDLAAIRLFLLYVVGKPAATPDPDTLDAQEIELFVRGSANQAVFAPIMKGLPADAALAVLRVLRPFQAEQYIRQITADPQPQPGADEEAVSPPPGPAGEVPPAEAPP